MNQRLYFSKIRIMLNIETEYSLRGRLIRTIIEDWLSENLFEQYESNLRDSLDEMLNSNLKFEVENFWDMNPTLIDNNSVAGNMRFIDEDGKIKVISFNILGQSLSTNEE